MLLLAANATTCCSLCAHMLIMLCRLQLPKTSKDWRLSRLFAGLDSCSVTLQPVTLHDHPVGGGDSAPSYTSPMGGRQDIPSVCIRNDRLALVGQQAYAGVCLDLARKLMALHRLSLAVFGLVRGVDGSPFPGILVGSESGL